MPAQEKRFWLIPGIICLLSLSMIHAAGSEKRAQEILDETGVTGGLVIHVGCGDGELIMAFASLDSFVAQGLDETAAEIDKARRNIAEAGLTGRASVDVLPKGRLPYVDNLVRLLIVEDFDAVSTAEVMRVLCPGGVAYVHNRDRWDKTIKEYPSQIDEWTHYLHDSDGNAVSADTQIGPPRHMQWLAAPVWSRNHHKLASISSVVSAGGRIFYIMDEATAADMSVPGKWFTVAHDAFNGVLLWRREMASWAYTGKKFRSGPVQLPRMLVTDGDRVYVPLAMNAAVSALDAATGKTVRTYPETEGAEEIIVSEGILLVLSGAPMAEQATVDPALKERARYPNRKTLCALSTSSGKLLWKYTREDNQRITPVTLTASGGRVFFQAGEGVICLDLETGKQLWSSAEQPSKPRKKNSRLRGPGWAVSTLVVQDGVVLLADGKDLTALSAEDGTELWKCPCQTGFKSPPDVFVIDGLVWTGREFTESRDLRTGEIKKTWTAAEDIWTVGHHHRCYREKATPRYIMTGKRGVEFLDLLDGEHTRNNWIRGVCQYGILPCNGLLYAPSHACGCFMEAKLRGFWAVASERSPRKAPPAERKLMPGPAYGIKLNAPETAADEWPTLRHDNLRSGSTPANMPATYLNEWKRKLGGTLTPPVTAGGLVVVASIDDRRISAMNAEDGTVRWTHPAAGRIDSPPTLYRGLVIFGSSDGRVTCLRASDGQPVWQFRAAPDELKTVSLNQVESLWPVHGSVLVDNGLCYVAAGRSSYLDGGIRLYALDPATGRTVHDTTVRSDNPSSRNREEAQDETGISQKKISQNATDYKTFTDPDKSDAFSMGGTTTDVLVSDGDSIYLRTMRFDRQCRRQKTKGRHLFSTSRLLDDAENHRSHWMVGTADFSRTPVAYSWIANRGGTRSGTVLSVPFGLMLTFDQEMVWGVRRDGYTLFAQPHQPFSPNEEPLPDFRAPGNHPPAEWTWSGATGMRPRAMLRAGNILILGGMPDEKDPLDPHAIFEGETGGILMTVSVAEGMKLAQLELPSPPVWDGMAAAGGKLYVTTMSGHLLCLSGDESVQASPKPLPPGAAKGPGQTGSQRRGKQRQKAGKTQSGSQPGSAGGEYLPGKPVKADSAGKYILKPETARTTGRLRYQAGRNNLGAWTQSQDTCQWNLAGVPAGKYTVEFAYGSTNPGIDYTIAAGQKEVKGKTERTGGIKIYKSFHVGTIALPQGDVTLTVSPGKFEKGALMNFRLLTLVPEE